MKARYPLPLTPLHHIRAHRAGGAGEDSRWHRGLQQTPCTVRSQRGRLPPAELCKCPPPWMLHSSPCRTRHSQGRASAPHSICPFLDARRAPGPCAWAGPTGKQQSHSSRKWRLRGTRWGPQGLGSSLHLTTPLSPFNWNSVWTRTQTGMVSALWVLRTQGSSSGKVGPKSLSPLFCERFL